MMIPPEGKGEKIMIIITAKKKGGDIVGRRRRRKRVKILHETVRR